MFEKVVGDDSARYCTTRAASAGALADSPDAATGRRAVPGALGRPRQARRRPYGSDDSAHTATEPCGAYGCSCEFRPELC